MKDWFLKYWAEVACGALVLAVTTMYKRNMAMRNGMRAMLRYEIIKGCTYWIRMGYCPQFERDAICDMFEQYTVLKGNHGVCVQVDEMLKLPTEKPKRTRNKGEQPLS